MPPAFSHFYAGQLGQAVEGPGWADAVQMVRIVAGCQGGSAVLLRPWPCPGSWALGARKRNRTQRPSTEQPEVPPSQPVSSVRAATSPPVPIRWGIPPSYRGVVIPPPDRNPAVNWEPMMGFPSGDPPFPNS
ncbi:hypothetical protein LA080_006051 [Diaporthe eres]|nr:hypothetical protein LA080_006051 [Diaporthe eres]